MALNAQFAATPQFGSALLTTADSILTGTPTNVSAAIITGTTNGTRISKIIIKSTKTGAQAASIIRLWLHDGTNFRLIYEVALPATTQSATVAGSAVILSELTHPDLLPLILKNTHSIRASTSVSETVTVSIFGADI